ncbi:MAG: hypothetical protein AAFR61_04200 [Bacteroidota bacterium]
MQCNRPTGFQPVKPSAAAASCGYVRWESPCQCMQWNRPTGFQPVKPLPQLQAAATPAGNPHVSGCSGTVTLASSR